MLFRNPEVKREEAAKSLKWFLWGVEMEIRGDGA